ncbi:hypothetical protein ACFQ0B_42160 [Nonomuraea thailandensis]
MSAQIAPSRIGVSSAHGHGPAAATRANHCPPPYPAATAATVR